MCGIAGFVGTGDRDVLRAMVEALAHRGPDGEGYYVDAEHGLHLGHRRLAVVDLPGGEQPMWDREKDTCVLFNGEIYNHRELRCELESKGYIFRSDHSDTETLVYGYKQWGDELPLHLNGMFAFAVYDRRRRRLLLARDRFGEKPLYYADRSDLFAFSSELASLTRHPALPRTVDPIALRKLFAYGYIPSPYAYWRNCQKLPAGHLLRYDLVTRRSETAAYWTFALEPEPTPPESQVPHLAEELRHHVQQSVGRRLAADVPLGIFLSGGLDSSAVAACAARMRDPSSLKTFTIGFNEPSFDESPHARLVARHVGTDHRNKILDVSGARNSVEMVLRQLDEPLGDASVLPTYLLASFTRQFVTVALSGDGGDELFGGYDPFRALGPASVYANVVPATLHALFRNLAGLLPASDRNMAVDFKIKRALQGMSYPEAAWAPAWMAPLDQNDITALLGAPVSVEDLYGDAIELWENGRHRGLGPVERLLEFFTRFYLPDNVLTKVDRAAMMSSLEVRAIFLDNDIVEFCRRLPTSLKIRNNNQKYLLKRAFEQLLPGEIVNRRKKGFGIPTAKWLRTIPPEVPLDAPLGADQQLAARFWQEHRTGKVDRRLFLWTWLSAQVTSSGMTAAEISTAS